MIGLGGRRVVCFSKQRGAGGAGSPSPDFATLIEQASANLRAGLVGIGAGPDRVAEFTVFAANHVQSELGVRRDLNIDRHLWPTRPEGRRCLTLASLGLIMSSTSQATALIDRSLTTDVWMQYIQQGVIGVIEKLESGRKTGYYRLRPNAYSGSGIVHAREFVTRYWR